MQQEWFIDWFNSPYYHQLYFDRDEKEAANFIDKLVIHLNPKKNSKILDVACGKGRHAKQLAKNGFDVTGIDISKDSIDFASTFNSNNLHFYQHDMRLPCWINYFDYAFNFFTSFGYFNTQRENDDAIRTIAQSIKKNGTFVMDYLNVNYVEKKIDPNKIIEINDTIYTISKWQTTEFFFKKIEIEDKINNKKFIHTEKVAKFNLDNFTKMFTQQGLQLKEIFGNYQFGAFNVEQSPRLLMIMKKN